MCGNFSLGGKMYKKYLIFTLFVCLSAASFAAPWQWVGPRAMAMGGAGVAAAYGPDAQYWNPAALVQKEGRNEKGWLFNLGVNAETTKTVLKSIDKFDDLSKDYDNLSSKIKNGGTPNAAEVSTLFTGLSTIHDLVANEIGALANADAGLGLKFKNFAFSVRSLGNMGITPVIDTQNLGLGTQGGSVGLSLGATTTPVNPTNAAAANTLSSAIAAQPGLLADLNTLLGSSYASAQTLANAFVNAAVSAGSTPQQIADAANQAAANMGGAAPIIKSAASTGGISGYDNNQTRAMADMAVFTEASLGYGFSVVKGVQIGGNIKAINGTIAQTGIMLLQENDDVGDILKDAWDEKKNSTQLGIDVGALVNVRELSGSNIWFNPQFGITAKNINSPKFDRPTAPTGINPVIAASWKTGDYKLKPQIRAGAALNPLSFITLAADIDLTENETSIQGYDSRQLAAGVEINLVNRPSFNLPLRAGINKNVANSNAPMYFTAGLGFNASHFYMEFAGAISDERTKVDNTDIPAAAAASFNVGFMF